MNNKQLSRIPYFLLHPGDQTGCGYHRMFRPLEIMARNGYAAGRAEPAFLPDHILKALAPDTVVWQRQNDDNHLQHMRRYRDLLPDATFVYELDDAMSAVPPKSEHFVHIDPNIDARMAKAIGLCDVLTVTTHDLAQHMRKIAPQSVKIRVVPNYLSREDFDSAKAIRAQAKLPESPRLRIGWGGGIGHTGDLELLDLAIRELKDEVEWVFAGFHPNMPEGTHWGFVGSFAPQDWLRAFANFGVDLVVAPLEDNLFNRCKSNLKLLEAGACSYPVIASPVTPYTENSPPVYDYAESPQAWIGSIRAFIQKDAEERAHHGKRLHDWARRNYCYEDKLETRTKAWLKFDSAKPFIPSVTRAPATQTIIVCENPTASLHGMGTVHTTFQHAFEHSDCNILYVRSGTTVYPGMLETMNKRLTKNIGAVIAFSNDGGPTGLPKVDSHQPIDEVTGRTISDMFCAVKDDIGSATVATTCGPCMLISRAALNMLGTPDFTAFTTPELAIIEWSAGAAARGYKTVAAPVYALTQPLNAKQSETETCAMRILSRWPQAETDMPALNKSRQKVELRLHRDFYQTPPLGNDYPAWMSRHVIPGPKTLEAATNWYSENTLDYSSVRYNAGSVDELGESEWYLFSHRMTTLSALAPAWLSNTLADNPGAKIIYGDHDIRNADGQIQQATFKSSFDLHLLLAQDYITPIVLVHGSLVKNLERDTGVSQLHRRILFMALSDREIVAHCPHVLGTVDLSTLSEDTLEKRSNVEAAAGAFGLPITVKSHDRNPQWNEITYHAPEKQPSVSIIIPCRDNLEMLQPCIASILRNTNYTNYEIVVVDNASSREDFLAYLEAIKFSNVRVLQYNEPFNWSKVNNWAVAHSSLSEYFCFLNDDTRVLTKTWLDQMVGAASIGNVGAVGARLLYPHGAVQHIGVVADQGVAGHIHKGLPAHELGSDGIAVLNHEATAVTGACLLVSQKVFKAANGFDPDFEQNFNDVAFCLELRRRGYVNVVAIGAELQHFEGVTRNPLGMTPEAENRLRVEGTRLLQKYGERDAYWNQNLLIYSVHNGVAVAGLQREILNQAPEKGPWEDPISEKILLLGEAAHASDDLRDGATVYVLSVQGNQARFIQPPMENCAPFDLRDPDRAKQVIDELGIGKVLITTVGEQGTSVLPFLARLGVEVEYRPVHAESICLQRDLKQNKQPCADGWVDLMVCQKCVEHFSSPNGLPSTFAWRAEWLRFLSEPNVTANLGLIRDPIQMQAIIDVFGGSNEVRATAAL